MEEICQSLSAVLCENGTGGYSIYYEEELLEALPEDMRNRETLEAALKNLRGGGYIDVKYARGNAFCIAGLKQYRIPAKPEETPEEAADESVQNMQQPATDKRIFWLIALCSFLGGAAGGGVAAIISAVI